MSSENPTIMIFDTPNILFRVHSANLANQKHNSDEALNAGLAMHMGFRTVQSHFRKFNPDVVAFAFEGGKNWRKTYTTSSECVSKRKYKGNRVHTDSSKHFFELVDNFKEFVKNYTAALCLNAETLEGDDLIAGAAKRYSDLGYSVIIVSGDRDFVQLLRYKNVRLVNSDKGKDRTCDDPDYFLFEKCIRGDSGDNVMSAFPRVRSTRIEKAYRDEYERTNLMNETWSITDPETGEITKYRVGDLFEENKLLMDLDAQPEEIKKRIDAAIDFAVENRKSFSYFQFMKFLGKHELNAIADESTKYTQIFSTTEALKEQQRKSSLVSF
jgi:hypothetical protein